MVEASTALRQWGKASPWRWPGLAPRRARAELKERLKRGGTTLTDVLKAAESDEVLGKMKVSALLEALPGVGKVRAQQIMERLEIAPSRRLRGLGERQRKALLTEFSGE